MYSPLYSDYGAYTAVSYTPTYTAKGPVVIQPDAPWSTRSMNNASSIAALLAEHDLSTYAKDFEEHGWDSLTALQNISDGDLEQLIADVAMKSGHISRLRKALGKAPVARATALPAVGPAEAQGVPDPVPGAAAAQPAAAGQPAGDATGGQPAPAPAMSADQAMLQRKLHMKLTSTNVLGQLEHGTIINTYQSGTELMIRIVSEELFFAILTGQQATHRLVLYSRHVCVYSTTSDLICNLTDECACRRTHAQHSCPNPRSRHPRQITGTPSTHPQPYTRTHDHRDRALTHGRCARC